MQTTLQGKNSYDLSFYNYNIRRHLESTNTTYSSTVSTKIIDSIMVSLSERSNCSEEVELINISINQLCNLKEYHLSLGWQSHIKKVGINTVESVYPLQNFIIQTNEEQIIPSLDKWFIYIKDYGIISFKDYTISKGGYIKLPIKKDHVEYFNSHFSYVQNLF